MGDLDMLIDMGFDRERASIAIKNSGNLQGAIDWLEKHQDKSLDDIKAEQAEATAEASTSTQPLDDGQEAKSLIDFAESTQEIAPLTEEQKAQRLAELREKLAAKRAGMSEQDKEDKRKNDEIKRKATKEGQDIKEQLQQKERMKEAQQKQREKKEDELARKRVLDQIQNDREERRRKAEMEKAAREGKPLPVAEEPKPAPVKKASAATEARLRLQTPSGMLTKTLPAELTLFELAHQIAEEKQIEVSEFSTTYPKKSFVQTDFGMTLKEAGMVPSAVVIVKSA